MVSRVLLSAAGLATAAAAHSALFIVDVMHDDFNPDPTIVIGDTVRWVWMSDLHTTTSVAGSAEVWNSGIRSVGSTFDYTFSQEGAFNYYCQVHGFDNGNGTAGGMSGTVTVQAVPEPATMAALGSALAALAVRRRWR